MARCDRGNQYKMAKRWTLGFTGRSGRAMDVHLYYSVSKQGVLVNPARYLALAIDFVRTY